MPVVDSLRRGTGTGPARPRADVALDEAALPDLPVHEVFLRRRLDLGRREGDLGALQVDLAVAGQADDDELAACRRAG